MRTGVALFLVRYWIPLALGVAGLSLFLLGRCSADEPVTPGVTGFVDIEEGRPPEERGAVRTITHRTNPVLRSGDAPTKTAKQKAKKFAESYADSTLPAELPEVKLIYDDDRLDLSVGDSKGILHRRETDCPQPCSAGTRGNELFSESPRTAGFPKWRVGIGAAVVTGVVVCLVACK